jgi:hypothetical protein
MTALITAPSKGVRLVSFCVDIILPIAESSIFFIINTIGIISPSKKMAISNQNYSFWIKIFYTVVGLATTFGGK